MCIWNSIHNSWPFENEIYQTVIVSFIWRIIIEKFENSFETSDIWVCTTWAPAAPTACGSAVLSRYVWQVGEWRQRPRQLRRDVARGPAGAARQSLHDRGTDSVEPLRCKRLTFESVKYDSLSCVCIIVSINFLVGSLTNFIFVLL